MADISAALLAEGTTAGPTVNLSSVKLAEAVDDRASFRRFSGFSRSEATPERTAFVRFRKALLARGVGESPFAEITEQFRQGHIQAKKGTLVDTTIIASASKEDVEARWVRHKRRKAIYGYKAHVASDQTSDLVEKVSVTPANVSDRKAGVGVLLDDPGNVYADSAYRGARFLSAVDGRGGTARVVVTSAWAKSDEEARSKLKTHNGPIHKVRRRIEKIFGTWKRSYGLRQMMHRGMAKATLQVQLTAIAYNLKRSLNLGRAQTV